MRPPGSAERRIARGFDRLAPIYDVLADVAFVGRIHASQISLLPRLPRIRRAVVVGGGTGRFLARFLAHDPSVSAVSIDASAEMTRRTAERLAAQRLAGRVELRTGGLEELRANERFDLVVTHCFLDLFEEPELSGVVSALARALDPGGHWLFSDFVTPGKGLPRLTRGSIVAALYTFFRVTCGIDAKRLPDFDRAFEQAGLKCLEARAFALGLLEARILRKT